MTQPMRPGVELTDRYRLEERLGSGGMGEVWRGFDLHLERPVAIKLLRPGLFTDTQALARFHREGKAAARLNHPAIAAVHDVSAHQGKPFLVLELLDGHNLETVLGREPQGLAIEQVLNYGAQIAEGLAAAHAVGVVHRDIKPANVMLLPSGQIKIYDFGIAWLHDATRLTSVDSVVGTPRYMAPEPFRNEPIDVKADLYSLGATLFHLLTGHPPYLADNPVALIGMHLKAPVPSARSIRPGLSSGLDAYLQTLLAKDPAERPSAADVAHHLPTLTGPHQQPPPASCVRNLPADHIWNLLAEAEDLARADADITLCEQARLWREIGTVLADRDPAHARDLLTEAARDLLTETERFADTPIVTNGVPLVDSGSPQRWGWLRRRKTTTRTERGPSRSRAKRESDALIAVKVRAARIRGEQLSAEMEQIASRNEVRSELQRTTQALAGLHPVGAERFALAAASDGPLQQARVLAEVAELLTDRDPRQAQRILAKAERLARTLTDPGEQAYALTPVVAVLARLNLAQAELLTDTIPEEDRTWALQEIVRVVSESDPDQAERLAGTIPDKNSRARTLAQIADTLAPQHPDRARALLTEAEHLARTTAAPSTLIAVLIGLAKVTAGRDPHRATELLAEAEHLARDHSQYSVGEIVGVLAALDVVESERLARTLTNPHQQTRALVSIVRVQAEHDLVEAVYLAQTILQSPELTTWGEAEVVAAVAEQDADQAERLARTLTDPGSRLNALMEIAKVTAGRDPRRATELLAETEQLARDHSRYSLGEIVRVLAALDPGRAERIARTLTGSHCKLKALMEIARVKAEHDPDRAQELLTEAEGLARSLTRPLWQASTLVKIAQLHTRC